MGKNIKVSVIIPVYNTGKYLKNCLDSVINQTLKDIEIICINDGSKDNSLDILKEHAKKYEHIKIFNQRHKGAGAARNKGLKKAIGEYVYFLDGDDFIKPDALEKAYKKITETNSEICIFKNRKLHETTQEYESCSWEKSLQYLPKKEVFNKYDIPDNFFMFCNIPAWTKLYRASFIKKFNLKFQTLTTCNDVYFNYMSLCMAKSITFLNEELITWRVKHNCTTTTRGEHIHCILDAFTKLKKDLIKKKIFDKLEITFYKRAKACYRYEIKQLKTEEEKEKWTLKLYRTLPIEYWTKEACRLNKINEKREKERQQNMFSIQNIKSHKVISLLGLKIKIKSKQLEQKEQLRLMDKKIKELSEQVKLLLKIAENRGELNAKIHT